MTHRNAWETGLQVFADRIGFTGEMDLLREAATHKSFANEAGKPRMQNERLEFLGDAVLELVVSHGLMVAHPTLREGDLSRLRASIVNMRSLAEVSRRLDIGPILRLGRGEDRTDGRQKPSVLADAYEAIIGAVYLGMGLEAARAFIELQFGERIRAAQTSVAHRDFKTRLQEHAQQELSVSPTYEVVGSEGPDHAKTFFVQASVKGEVVGEGSATSKKQAERAAAKQALENWADRAPKG